jgi:23S rRNA (guanosine2251-2'-O)-methyltransferase
MNNAPLFQTQECSSPTCGFRFPSLIGASSLDACPKCGAPLHSAGQAYPRHSLGEGQIPLNPLEVHVLLDNIRSLYNVGSIFRTAEALGVAKLHLCGITATPENPRLAKTALGAETLVAWEQHNNGLWAARSLREQGFDLWSIEGGERSESLFGAGIPSGARKIALVIGNELAGVDPKILEISDRVLYIPMLGEKESLNLTVAFGIAAYFVRYSQTG